MTGSVVMMLVMKVVAAVVLVVEVIGRILVNLSDAGMSQNKCMHFKSIFCSLIYLYFLSLF